jgi:hypothetical protein
MGSNRNLLKRIGFLPFYSCCCFPSCIARFPCSATSSCIIQCLQVTHGAFSLWVSNDTECL